MSGRYASGPTQSGRDAGGPTQSSHNAGGPTQSSRDAGGPNLSGRGAAGRHAWIDAGAGIAGDMLLGALLDAGATVERVQAAVDAVLPGAVRLSVEEVRRAGLRATKAHVTPLAGDPPHRTWRDIRALLGDRQRAAAVFGRLAEAEAKVHGVDPEDVHFHEVGALDSIADVVGVCAALEELGVATVSAGEVALGSGTVRAAHGRLPVPAPAVAELATGWPVRGGGSGELATPTGMALIRALAVRCETLPPMVVEAVGVGAGSRDTPDRPNVVRVLLGEPTGHHRAAPSETAAQSGTPGHSETAAPSETATPSEAAAQSETAALSETAAYSQTAGRHVEGGGSHEAVLLEANVDDLDPRLWPGVLAGLLDEGADDAWLVPILMKKGRPAHTLCVLARPDRAARLRERIFRDTTTLGVRESGRTKTALARAFHRVAVGGGDVRIKVGYADGVVVQVMPEFEDVAAVARATGRAERAVLQEALAAAAAAGLGVA